MNHKEKDVLDDIISKLQPEEVPAEYIIMAKVTDIYGGERILKGSEIADWIKNPKHDLVEAKLILDVRKIKSRILFEVANFFETFRVQFNRHYIQNLLK